MLFRPVEEQFEILSFRSINKIPFKVF